MKLYDLPAEIDRFEQKLVEGGGELTPELEREWQDFIAAGKDKIEAAAMVVRTLEAQEEACKQEADRLKKQQHQHERNVGRLKELMIYAVNSFGGKVKTSLFTVWTQRSAARNEITLKDGADLAELEKTHPQFVRIKRELNLEAVQQAAKNVGEELPACLVVAPKDGKEFLRIK